MYLYKPSLLLRNSLLYSTCFLSTCRVQSTGIVQDIAICFHAVIVMLSSPFAHNTDSLVASWGLKLGSLYLLVDHWANIAFQQLILENACAKK